MEDYSEESELDLSRPSVLVAAHGSFFIQVGFSSSFHVTLQVVDDAIMSVCQDTKRREIWKIDSNDRVMCATFLFSIVSVTLSPSNKYCRWSSFLCSS
jgi:hypothetical protein